MTLFHPAQRTQAKLRLAIDGPSGSGKTYSALLIAKGLASGDLSKVALIDTERGSGSLYADIGAYAVAEMHPPYSAKKFEQALDAAVAEGFEVVVIDSLSHAWAGEGGVLDYVDNVAKTQTKGNSFTAWKEGSKVQNALIDHILSVPCHVIATMRTKTEWVIEENEKGKKVPRKIGMAVKQRDDVEYEFTTYLNMSREHHIATASKDRTGLFDDRFEVPSEAMGAELLAWLGSAAPEPPRPAKPTSSQVDQQREQHADAQTAPPAAAPPENGNGHISPTAQERLRALIYAKGRDVEQLLAGAKAKGIGDGTLAGLTMEEATRIAEGVKRLPDPEPPQPSAAQVPQSEALAEEAPTAPQEPQQEVVAPAAASATPESPEGRNRPDGCTLDHSFQTCAQVKAGKVPECGECQHFDASWAPLDAATRGDAPAAEAPRKKGSITKEQLIRVAQQTAELESLGIGTDEWRFALAEQFGVAHRDELVKTTTAPKAIDYLARWLCDVKSGVRAPGEAVTP